MSLAPGTGDFYRDHSSENLAVFNVLRDGGENQAERALEWATAFGLDHPVLFDHDERVSRSWKDVEGKPRYAVIDVDLTITYRGHGVEAQAAGFDEVLRLLE